MLPWGTPHANIALAARVQPRAHIGVAQDLLYHPDIGASRQRGCHPSGVDLIWNAQDRWCRPAASTTGYLLRSLRDQERHSVAPATT